MSNILNKKNLSLLVAAVLVCGAFVIKGGEVFTTQMVRVVLLATAGIVLWVFQPVSIGTSALFVMAIQPLLGVNSINAAFSGFANPVNFFTIASFGIAYALSKSSVPKRILSVLIRICGEDTKKITLAFMILTYLVSTIISDITAVIIGIEFVMELLELIEDGDEKKKLGRLFLIGVPLASMLGGTATPVGSSINVLALNMLKAHNGADVTFTQWMLAGFPISLVTLFATWFFLTRIYKAGNIDKASIDAYKTKTAGFVSKLEREKTVVFILAVIVVMWVLSSWIPILNTTTVAVLGLVVLMLPFVNAFSWKEFSASVSWELPIMGAATISLGNLVVSSGIVQMLIDKISPYLPYGNGWILIGIVALLVTVVLFFIPVGPATVSIFAIPAFLLGEAMGVNPIMPFLIVAMFASNTSIIPLNAVMYIPYSKGYWKIYEVAKVGVLMSIVWILLSMLWLPIAAGMF